MAFLTESTKHLRALLLRWICGVAAALALGLAPRTVAAAPAAISPEYQLKAVFLFNFAQFVDWPATAFPDARSPLVIGVLGKDPFGSYLDELVKGENVGGRPIVIERYLHLGEVRRCHILFISSSEARHLGRIMAALRGRSVFTVSDLDGFNRAGGMVRFVVDEGKIRLRVNLDAVKAADLAISSKILRASTIVAAGGD